MILTLIEISITLLSVFEISKGATLHQLNSLHLKNSAIFSRQVSNFTEGNTAQIKQQVDEMQQTMLEIKQQPLDCLDLVNPLNIFVMKAIGTYQAYELCIKDIEDVDEALDSLDQFRQGNIDTDIFLANMQKSAIVFNDNSALFEKPITETVNFLLKIFIPLVLAISIFNILFITYLSRTITESIDKVIKVLKSKDVSLSDEQIYTTINGELRELLKVAIERARETLVQEEINDKLEALVLERTESLTHVNDELSKFAYRTSHDLKGPVSASKALAQFIQQDITTGDYDNATIDAQKVEMQMAELEAHISGILSLTKATEIENSLQTLNIHNLLNSRIDALREYNKDENVEITIDADKQLFFEVNKVRLQQVIDNLSSNAIKYADPREHSWLRIVAYIRNKHLCIEFNDNGIGFPAMKEGEAFQMFTRFHASSTKGSGIGLAIVKKHVDLMGGSITLDTSQESGENKGSRFLIQLPENAALADAAHSTLNHRPMDNSK